MTPIELLAPARDYNTARAAVDYGADAVYMGASRFGARQSAGNSLDDIARAVAYARPYHVRVYATLNTLLFDNELEEAEKQARELLDAGVDALIVQDMAYRRMNLGAELHASTQAATRTAEQTLFLERCGFSRVVLERALSRAAIQKIRNATSVELECFVHGAICVGYSGRCFFSRSMSSGETRRSGNRGDCSQPCRLTWDLVDVDGKMIEKHRPLLSLRDLNLSERLGELLDAGVTSLKIEGRLKSENYVKNVVAHYRRQLDEALASRPELCRSSIGESAYDFTPDPAKSFTRGSTEYFWNGRNGVKDLLAGEVDLRDHDHHFVQTLKRSRTRRVIPVNARLEVCADDITLTLNDLEIHFDGCFERAKDSSRMAETITEQLYKCGDTIFDVRNVEVVGSDWFVPVSQLAKIRRDGFAKLLEWYENSKPAPRITPENPTAIYPSERILETENVTNHLASQFYRDHGVREIAPPLELAASTLGAIVMQSRFCLRRELGHCLKNHPTEHSQELFLVHGRKKYRLHFDCSKCEMSLIHVQ